MPNWCKNTVTFTHKDPAAIQRIADTVNADKPLFQEFVPMPEGEEDWYNWHVENWGTKWDTNADYISTTDKLSVKLGFDTAWAPPISFYMAMEDLGYTVDAKYYEPGMGFLGSYSNGIDNEQSFESFDEIPQEFVDEFGIEDWEEEE